ncbi:MAG: STAS domain-containing protein [Hahellaceae bacterium]|nr:STAS domain-containing protein [Hahellaceae bacterium]
MSFELTWSAGDAGSMPVLSVIGIVNFDNAPQVWEQGQMLIREKASAAVTVDVGQISSANSALFSVLLRWMAQAHAQSLAFTIRGVSSKLMDVARVSGLETVLPLHAN